MTRLLQNKKKNYNNNAIQFYYATKTNCLGNNKSNKI